MKKRNIDYKIIVSFLSSLGLYFVAMVALHITNVINRAKQRKRTLILNKLKC